MRRLLFPLLACSFILGAIPATAGAASGPSSAKYVCVIVLDGGRPDYLTKNIKSLPNLRAMIQHGRWYNRAFVGSLMSITPPDHAVIGTGSFPKNDGGT